MGWIPGKNAATRATGSQWLRLRTPAPELRPVGRMKAPLPVRPDSLPAPGPNALRALVTPRAGPVVTLYAPLRSALSGARAKAAYQGAVADAVAELEKAGVPEAEAQEIRSQLGSVETRLGRFERPAAGLAVFHDRSSLHAFPLQSMPAPSVTVAENFALRPLLAEIRRNRRFFVLALSANRIALFRGDAFGLSTIGAHGVPASLVEPGFDVARFHRRVARALEAALAGSARPIVLVATRAHHAGLRAVLRLPRLLAAGVEISPDHLSSGELHARTWPLVNCASAAEETRFADGYERSVSHGKGLHRIDEVAMAAAGGRIHRLWVRPHERMPGAIDPVSGALVGGGRREDVFDGLVTLVLRHGGEVLVADRIPSGDSLAAELH
jgi:hypothetical protein